MLTKPISGGTPTSAAAATVNTPIVKGMTFEKPRSSCTYSRFVLTSTAPAQKNSVIFITPWKSICVRLPVRPAGDMSVAPNMI